MRSCIAISARASVASATTLFALGSIIAGAVPAYAAGEPERSRGVVAVEVRPGSDAPVWLPGALEEHLARELSTYERLRVERSDPAIGQQCANDDACAIERYREIAVDVVFIATARADALHYALYETWTPSKVREGAIDLRGGVSLIGLRQSLLRVFAPVLTSGGLLDQKPYRARADTRIVRRTGRDGRTPVVTARHLATFLAALGLFFLLPLVIATLGVKRTRRLQVGRWPSTWLAVASIAAAIVVASRGSPLRPWAWPSDAQWFLGLVGGTAWGAFAVSNIRLVVPALPGLDRVGHRDVFRLIRAWLVVGAVRFAALASYYLPFALASAEAVKRLGLSREAAILLVGPAVALGARLWLSSWIRALTLRLDERLVAGDPSPDNPWHKEVCRYFTGYLRRTGWALEPEVLGSILFLPGRQEGIRCYGGGSIPARVVIDEPTLTFAIGAAEEAGREKDEVVLASWSAGLVVAQPPARRAKTSRGRGLRASAASRTQLARPDALISPTGHQHKQLGQAATLLGYIRPEPGARVPLIADTVEDLEVVRGLLAEHYQWFAPDPDDDDDDTDPTDKDFLFGALAYAVGRVVRRDSQLGVFSLALTEGTARGPRLLKRLHRFLGGALSTFIGRSPAVVADAYPALHYARHHHLQYLWHRWTAGDDGLLTVRAGIDELERTSTSILRDVRSRMVESARPQDERGSFQRRMVWLSSFFAERLVDKTERRVRRLRAAVVAAAALSGFGVSVYHAVRYHPLYVERIAEQERRHRQSLREEAHEDEGSASHVHD